MADKKNKNIFFSFSDQDNNLTVDQSQLRLEQEADQIGCGKSGCLSMGQ